MQDENKYPKLHRAVLCQDIDLVKSILNSHPDDIHTRDTDGDTPLHLACRLCSLDIINILITRGADTDIKNNYDETPYDHIVFDDIKDHFQHFTNHIETQRQVLESDIACLCRANALEGYNYDL